MIDNIVRKMGDLLDENGSAFLSRVYSDGLEKYSKRLMGHGFQGHNRVLDAGCGFGQWSLPLADMNDNVVSIDIQTERLIVLRELARENNVTNIEIQRSSVCNVNQPDSSFDAIFCYGTLFLTPWKETLAEFQRLLKPGGLLYVNANGAGWYRFLWESRHNQVPGYDPRELAARAYLNTWTYENTGQSTPGLDIIITPIDLKDQLSNIGFENILAGPEGTVRHSNQKESPLEPFFLSEYFGQTGAHEILATKQE